MEKTNTEWAKDIPCRNVIIYGYCKKENEGCPFRHQDDEDNNDSFNDIAEDTSRSEETPPTIANHTIIHSNAPFASLSLNEQPSSISSSAPVATPPQNNISLIAPISLRSATDSFSSPNPNLLRKFNAKVSASFTPMGTKGVEANTSEPVSALLPTLNSSSGKPLSSIPSVPSFAPSFDPYAAKSFTPTPSSGNLMSISVMDNDSMEPQFPFQMPQMGNPVFPGIPSVNTAPQMNLKYPTIYPPPHSLLQYHLYAPDPPPHFNLSLKPNEQLPESLFIPNNLREKLVKRNLAALQVFPSGGALPDIVQDYFGFVPLDFHKTDNTKDHYLGHKNSLYKVFSNLDGVIYILRRIHDVKIPDPSVLAHAFQEWSKLSSANITKLVDLFVTTKFGDLSLCAVHDYYPQATSLYDTHFVNFPLVPITQEYLWTYLVQLTNAIKVVHSHGLWFGSSLDWDKVIVTGDPGRIKVSGCELVRVLENNNTYDIGKEHNTDYTHLGQLLKKLAIAMEPSTNPTIEELTVDDQFKTVLTYLLDEVNTKKNIKDLSSLFYDKILETIDSCQSFTEYSEGILSKELENGRLFRLMCKLNCIFGRMESRVDINWSESGEKFPIILFYDFVFHQMDETGKCVMDLTHALRCLNKLDAGVHEKIMLVTPDEMNCITISYKELKDLVDCTFRSLTQ